MKRLLTLLCFLMAANVAVAQDQKIGIIDFFGLRSITEQQARSTLPLQEGDTLPLSLQSIEEQYRDSLHVAEAHLNIVCCDDSGNLIVFVGVRETRARHSMYRTSPHWDISLPTEITDAYNNFFEALQNAVSKGNSADDISQGHSLMADSATRSWQLRFIGYARHRMNILKTVLRNSADAEQRAVAAYVLGYAADKRLVTEELQNAVVDEDEVVRNNAARALAAIATLAQRRPALRIKISSAPFINLLGSTIWTDRNKALMILSILTKKRDRQLLRRLHDREFASLVEMARWRSRSHAHNAYLILGRVAGVSELTLLRTASDVTKRNLEIAKIVKANRKR